MRIKQKKQKKLKIKKKNGELNIRNENKTEKNEN